MWWAQKPESASSKRAVAYYRHSAQDRQENSIPIQQEQVREFAEKNGMQIIKEFMDNGKSGLSTDGRDGFLQMINEYVMAGRESFEYILVLDVSRWGRFQDTDQSAYYTGLCGSYGIKVIYTTLGFPKEDGLIHTLQLNIERYRAASYSKELSGKVFRGCVKIAEQGFWAGGMPPYGFHRLLLDEQRNPVQPLEPGQRKSIQNQRVTLTPGDPHEIAVVKRIFDEFVYHGHDAAGIAAMLNAEKIFTRSGSAWNGGTIKTILTNELYIGTMIYNKTQQRLKSPSRPNPRDAWIRHVNAFPAIIDKDLFSRAQVRLAELSSERKRRFSQADMLTKLERLYKRYGKVGPRQLASFKDMPSESAYTCRFASLNLAFQTHMFGPILNRVRGAVIQDFRSRARQVDEYDDYVVLNDSFSVLIQPSIQVSFGGNAFWPFRPDDRREIDITLGIPLAPEGDHAILGYLVFPRMFIRGASIKLYDSSTGRIAIFGYSDLNPIWDLLE